jgi:hypothetical protein
MTSTESNKGNINNQLSKKIKPSQIPQLDTPTPSNGLTAEQITTLCSLELVDDYPLYTMVYTGAYVTMPDPPPDTRTMSLDSRSKRLTNSQSWACSLFASLGDSEQSLYGRNFDWDYSPAVLLFTNPPEGYASVSMVDIAYLGFDRPRADDLLNLPLEKRVALLSAPSWPFDGMNEHGLAIGMAAVPTSYVPFDPEKQVIGSIELIRQVLDNAADIDQAIEIISSYNIDFTGGPGLHYLIADASGKSVLVEFYDGQMQLISGEHPWHQATNFVVSAVDNPQGQCGRYNKLTETLELVEGRLSPENALDLLASVSQSSTQWSILYHMISGEIEVVMGRDFDSAHKFQLKE